jgi:hypothetical protein
MPAPIAGPACLLVGPIIQLDLTTCLAAVLGD